jgi:hypothetical protein
LNAGLAVLIVGAPYGCCVVQFGRGHIAGVDVRQQKKEADRFYEEFLAKRRTDEDKARDTYVSGSILSHACQDASGSYNKRTQCGL